jgi:putative ABC transport system permease protein
VGRITQNAIALRIARRSVKRNRLQSALIIAIIALPMALAGFALTYVESSRPTGPELVKYQLGLAQARYQVLEFPNEKLYQLPTDSRLSWNDYIPTTEGKEYVDVAKALPGLELTPISNGIVDFKTATGIGSISVVEGDSWNSAFLSHGPTDKVSGRVPANLNEVLVSPDALDRFGVKLGDQVSTVAGESFKVVGVLREASRRANEDVVYFKAGALADFNPTPADTVYFQLDGTSPSWAEIQKLNTLGVAVVSRSVLLNPPPQSEVNQGPMLASIGTLIGLLFLAPLVLLPVIVLAGSAFAFGARRQTRTLAVLSSLGANAKLLRKVTLASGVWLGLIGGLIGLSIGVVGVFFFGPNLADYWSGGRNWYNYPGFHFPAANLGLALLAAVILGAITSLVPAIRASKVNVLATLRGSRAEGQVRLRSGVGALVLLLVGVSAIVASLLILIRSGGVGTDWQLKQALQLIGVLLGLGGAVVTIVSFIVGTGWILKAIRKVMSRFGSTANYAGKDLLYNRKRYSPVIASVLTVTFVASFIASFFYGPSKFNHDNYQYEWLAGQAGVEFWVSPTGFDQSDPNLKAVSSENFWAGVPKRDRVESDRKLILSTGAFDSATIIDTTVDVANSGGVTTSDGTIAPQFDVPMPYVVYNPERACYFTGLSPKSQEWLQSHVSSMTSSDMKEPAGCVGVEDPKRTIVVGDAKELNAILKGKNQAALDTLESGGVVLFNKLYDYSGEAKVSWLKPSDYSWTGRNLENATKTVALKSYLVNDINSNSFHYSSMISRETAAKLGIKAYPMSVVVNYTGDMPQSATDELNGRNIYLSYANGTGVQNPETFAWVIILLAALFSLASTGIALGLSQIEARTDKRTLSALGAPRSFRARLVSGQAFALTLTGSLLGAGTGLMLGAAMLNGMDSALAQFPWVQLATLVFGVPAIAAAAFWLFTPRSLKYEVRQALD